MQIRPRHLAAYVTIAMLVLSPVLASAQSDSVSSQNVQQDVAPLVSADDQFLASFGSFFVNLLGNIHIFGGTSLGSILASAGGAANTPNLIPGSGWTGPTAQPANQGNPGSLGYNDDAITGWDDVPYQLVSGTFQVCVVAFHSSGINHVSFAVDGGAWVNVYNTTTTGPSGEPEYCATATDSSFADGQHEFRAIAYPNAGIPRVLQSSEIVTATSGNPLIAAPAHGQVAGKQVVFSNGSGAAGFTDGTTYYLIWTGMTPGGYEVSATNGGAAITTTGNATFTATWLGAGNNEPQGTPGESLYLNTNYHGNILVQSKYVDPAGTDSGTCGSSGSPCATIDRARANLLPAGSANSFTFTNGSCNISRSSNGFLVGQAGEWTTSGTLPSPLVTGVPYWVVSAVGNNIQLSATPGGSCIVANTSGASGTQTFTADVGNDIIYLNAGLSYALGAASENSITNALQGWLNIEASPGTPSSSVAIASMGTSNGVRTNKVHVAVNINNVTQLGVGYNIWLDNMTFTGPGQVVSNSEPWPGQTVWYGGGYATNVTVTQVEYGFNPAILVRNSTVHDISSGALDNINLSIANTSYNIGVYSSVLETTSGDSPSGQSVLHFAPNALPSIAGQYWVFGDPSVPGLPTTATSPCISSSAACLSSANPSVGTATLYGTLIADIPSGTTMHLAIGSTSGDYHTHWSFLTAGGNNDISYGNTATSAIWGEGFFRQNNVFFDQAEVGDGVAVTEIAPYGLTALILEAPITNGYFANNSYNTGHGADARFDQSLTSSTAIDMVFKNNTCAYPSSITNAASGWTGVTVIGGNC